jgi:nicotinamidase-related amidase
MNYELQEMDENYFNLDKKKTALLIIDVQEKLYPVMDEKVYGKVKKNIINLVKGANKLNVPVFYTQQYTKGLGETDPDIKTELSEATFYEKTAFSCCGEQSFSDDFLKKDFESVIVTGMETHICVLQTVVDLVAAGFAVHVAADAVCSRDKFNWKFALEYMKDAGGISTVTETVLFQLLGKAGTEEFKYISKLIK